MKKKIINKNVLSLVFLLIFTAIISAIRFVQLKFFTDFDVACDNFKSYYFFNVKVNLKMLSYFMNSIILLYFLFLLVVFFLKKGNSQRFVSISEINVNENKNSLIAFSLLLFFVFNFVVSILYSSSLNKNEIFGNRMIFLMLISQFLLCIYFLYLFYCLKYKKFNKNKILNIIFIIPVFWGIMRVFNIMYVKDFLLLTPREFNISNFKIASSTMFLFYFSRFLIGANSKNNERNIIFFGYLAIFFEFINLIPKIIFYCNNLINKNVILTKSYEFNINIFKYKNFMCIDLLITLFILIFLIKYVFCWKKIVEKNS